jgi:hypothetical protein
MATILLTDEEYNHIQASMNDLLAKVENASPRAATHYGAVAKLHADFLAKEDGKRASSKMKVGTRAILLDAKQKRRNKANAQPQAASATTRTAPTAAKSA